MVPTKPLLFFKNSSPYVWKIRLKIVNKIGKNKIPKYGKIGCKDSFVSPKP